jgi:hypothetical protein
MSAKNMNRAAIPAEERVKCLQALRMVAASGATMKGASLDSYIHKYSFINHMSLAHCFVNTSAALNPNDKALRGLLMILGYEDSQPNWINLGALQSNIEDRLIDFDSAVEYLFDPGIDLMIEAISENNGLANLDQLCNFLKKDTFSSAYSQVVDIAIGDPAIGTPEEPRYTLCATVSDIHYEAQDEGCDPRITIKDLVISPSLTELLSKADSSVLGLFYEYEAIMRQADESIFRLEGLYVLKNAEKAIEFPLGIRLDGEGGFKLSDHYDQLEILTSNKDFLAELRKSTAAGTSEHYLKGRLLEQELGF